MRDYQRKKHAIKINKTGKRLDFPLVIATLIIGVFGLLMVYNASSVAAFADFGDKYYYLKEQGKWLGIGFISCFFLSRFDYRRFYNLSPFLLLAGIFFLAAVFIPGLGIKTYGASRWLNFRAFSFQPAELIKIVLVIYLAAWFSEKEKGRLWAFILLCSLPLVLIMLQPDMGTATILAAIAASLYFFSGAPLWHIGVLVASGLGAAMFLIKIAPYRFQRFKTFLDPSIDPLGASYHLRQILIALGSGGLFGVGLGQSRQKYAYLPESTTDSIFAIIGEEIGFVGATILILFFLFFLYRGFIIAKQASDRFGQLLAAGITSWLSFQVLVNLAAMVALIPLTGVPLPFISYGGSSLVVVLSSVGILLNISRQGKSKK